MGTGVPFVLNNFNADHSHKKTPDTRKGKDTAALKGMEINSGNPRQLSMRKETSISRETTQKIKRPTNGVRMSRFLFEPVATLKIKFIIFARHVSIFIPSDDS